VLESKFDQHYLNGSLTLSSFSYIEWIFKKQKKIIYGKDIVAPTSWQTFLTNALKKELVWKSYGDILGGNTSYDIVI
jgi:hypothetical protein